MPRILALQSVTVEWGRSGERFSRRLEKLASLLNCPFKQWRQTSADISVIAAGRKSFKSLVHVVPKTPGNFNHLRPRNGSIARHMVQHRREIGFRPTQSCPTESC
ncbi:uncharacterized protein YALI1_F16851g [Yarrowia lipolytica]|uniref:Uncharacterized protein n=1 Tax=Yarrowia lipolytica TaxID=4952 RepID=A0A1D8NN77_YARLL|nr:hypothetical protein YALI1_F16851g [Yarrowia lipolytica]